MKRALLVVVAAAILAAVPFVGTASAAQKTPGHYTLTMTCEKNVASSANVYLRATEGGTLLTNTIAMGYTPSSPQFSTAVITFNSATAMSASYVDWFATGPKGGSAPCAAQSSNVPGHATCQNSANEGAKIVIRAA